MSELFWIKEPLNLFKRKYITNIIPSKDLSYDARLNAMSRAIILICVLGYLFTRNIKIIISGVISLIGIVVIYNINNDKIKKRAIMNNAMKEGFKSELLYNLTKDSMTTPQKNNPMMNVLLPEISDNPTRKLAAPSFAPKVENEINQAVKENINPRLFQDLGDNIEFESSMRSFYTTANTQIPNDQKSFAQFCYGGMKSCKDGDDIECHSNNYRHVNHN